MTDEWVVLEPNEKQGCFQWSARGYKVRKSTLNEICSDFVQDVGTLDPLTYNHIKWAMQRALFDQEILTAKSDIKRRTEEEKVCDEDCANCPVRYECPDSPYEHSIENTEKRIEP